MNETTPTSTAVERNMHHTLDSIRDQLQEALAGDPDAPTQFKPPDGTIQQLQAYIKLIVDDVHQAASETVVKNAELTELHARVQAILDGAADAIITIDEDARIESLNHEAERMFGWTVDEARGRNINILMPSPYHEEHDGYLQRYYETNERRIIGIRREVVGQRKDGTVFPMDLHISEIRVSGRRIFTGIARDITDRKQAEDLLVATRDVTVFALAKLAESRDPETGEHLERMRAYSQILAEHLAETGPYTEQIDDEFLKNLYRSSPLHDIGKVGIPDAVLLKPGSLSDEEFAIMKRHTTIGAEALESTAQHASSGGFLAMGVEIARYHHERWNGAGYPTGLAGLDIPLAARIVALADVYDALTSVRVYKSAFDPLVARSMIEQEEAKHFDPAVIEAFHASWDAFQDVQKEMDGCTFEFADAGAPATAAARPN